MNIARWFTTPPYDGQVNRKNFLNVQLDAIGVGFASAAAPFLPVFLTRLGASIFEIGLLTSIPALTGLLLSIPLGALLQKQKNIIPWYSLTRFLVIASYLFMGLVTFFFTSQVAIIAILAIWSLITIPQTLLSISFSVVMNSVAGPAGRYELMTRRWSILGLTTAITVILVGQVLDWVKFPLNYQIIFIVLSLGGLLSYYSSNRIRLPDRTPIVAQTLNFKEQVRDYLHLILSEKPFISFALKQFVFLTGTTLAAPLFPIYFVRSLHAPDGWIAAINTAQTAILIFGYFFWTRQTKKRGSHLVLLATTFGISFYPIVTAFTHTVWPILFYAGICGIFQAGINLVFFDELMKTVPEKYSATFVAAAQSLQYLSSIIAPFLGTYLADHYGFPLALVVSGFISLGGFLLFAFKKTSTPRYPR